MIHELIKEQLNDLKINIDENCYDLIIPKKAKPIVKELTFELAHSYIIKLEKYLINPPSTFTLHDNWNKGVKPVDEIMQVIVTNDIGKMIKVDGHGYDELNQTVNNNQWEGWLPKKSVTILKEI